jgi:hypothetical protein
VAAQLGALLGQPARPAAQLPPLLPEDFFEKTVPEQMVWLQTELAVYQTLAQVAASRAEVLKAMSGGAHVGATAPANVEQGRVVAPRGADPVRGTAGAAPAEPVLVRIHLVRMSEGKLQLAAELNIPGYGPFTGIVGKELPMGMGRIESMSGDDVVISSPKGEKLHVSAARVESPGLAAATAAALAAPPPAAPAMPQAVPRTRPAPPADEPETRGGGAILPPPGLAGEQ